MKLINIINSKPTLNDNIKEFNNKVLDINKYVVVNNYKSLAPTINTNNKKIN